MDRDRPRRRVALRRRALSGLTPGARAARRGRRVPRAARPVRRGRHGAGAARDARRAPTSARAWRPRRVCLDKVLFKELMCRPTGCPRSTTWACARSASPQRAPARRSRSSRALGLPVFVKPAHSVPRSGSSRSQPARSCAALEEAFAHDALVIVEAMAPRRGGRVRRARTPRRPSAAARRRPRRARLAARGDRVRGRVVRLRGQVHAGRDGADGPARHLAGRGARGCASSPSRRSRRPAATGLARVDFFVDGEQVLLNELNTMPGFTPDERVREAAGRPRASPTPSWSTASAGSRSSATRRRARAAALAARRRSPEQRQLVDRGRLAARRQRR